MSGQNCPGCGKAQPPANQGAACACGSTVPGLASAAHGGSLPPTRPSATPAPPVPPTGGGRPAPHQPDDSPTLSLPVVPAHHAATPPRADDGSAAGGGVAGTGVAGTGVAGACGAAAGAAEAGGVTEAAGARGSDATGTNVTGAEGTGAGVAEAGHDAGSASSGEDFALRVRPYVTLPGSEERVLAQPLPPAAEPVVVAAEAEPGPRRRRRLPLIAAAAGGVVVLSLVVAGLLPEGAADDRAKPGPTYEEGTFRPPTEPSPSPISASPSAKPSKSARPASSAPAAPAAPEPTRSEPPRAPSAPVLRPGDRGPEVAELQRRLKQAFAYAARDNGVYTKGVESGVRFYQLTHGIKGDEPGVYGPATRKSLEAGTTG